MTTITEIMDTMAYGPAPESETLARDWLAQGPFGHFIGGSFSAPGDVFETRNPARDERLAQVGQGSAEDVDAAVAAARTALPGWQALSGHQRARHLYAIARQIQKRERLFAVLEALDNGKPLREARDGDIPLAVRHFYHHAGWAELVQGEFPDHAPHGVCGQIIPWNFPLLMLAWKIAPALAAGNTVVLKPAEYTPLTALLFAQVCIEAGLPAGVVNIVTGDGATGAALVAHPGVDKIAFTGSTEVGREIRRATAGTGRALTLELGGKSPFIVFADADLDAAVEGVVDAVWFNQGEVCCAGTRILVAEAVAAEFEARLIARMDGLRVGEPLDKSTDIGAIVHPRQHARIRDLLAQGVAAGGVLHQGQAPEGCFCPPALMVGVSPANPCATEEIFGPIAVMMPFRTPDEAVELANSTRYGLAASIWSENLTQAMDIAARVRAGVVWVNATNLFDANAPFGGMRESGFGREGAREGIAAYLRPSVKPAPTRAPGAISPLPQTASRGGIDRTHKLYIGGGQKRADSGQSYSISNNGALLGHAPLGNRKDIRNAVEAAHKAQAWSALSGHARAQVLYFLAENLEARRDSLQSHAPTSEIDAAIACAFHYAAWADKFDARVHDTVTGHITLAMKEPFGVMGLICGEEAPLAGFLGLVLPAIAMGNRVVALPAQDNPLAALELTQVFACSDIPGGVINTVSGPLDALAATLAAHDDVAALWCAQPALAEQVERESAGNLKPVWQVPDPQAMGAEFLRAATQIKTIWVPYGA
ncbi:MAG: aldehyde dehydrogenase family protein [Rhodobacteraceae bacterium]|nr:MAG: aldehyde dehydrogenase family protein [Paracoccaceae bacterium]